jgi:LemA protein
MNVPPIGSRLSPLGREIWQTRDGQLSSKTTHSWRPLMNRILLGCGGALLLVILLLGAGAVASYNGLVSLDQAVQAQWGQVENVYQRRADLVPNLVETVKGAAAFEKETFQAVTEARASVGQLSAGAAGQIANDPAAFKRFAGAQDQLSSALSRLLVVSERYPELKATAAFRDLQAQLEGTENRITVERQRFNEAARRFNTRRQSFPTVLVASFLGDRFREKAYFQATPGSQQPPKVAF